MKIPNILNRKSQQLAQYDRKNSMFEIGEPEDKSTSDYPVIVRYAWVFLAFSFLVYQIHHFYILIDLTLHHP